MAFVSSRSLQRTVSLFFFLINLTTDSAHNRHQKHHKSSRKSKRHRSPSTDSTSSSEDERRRKARKEKKRSKRPRDHDYDRKRRHRSRSHHRQHYSDESDSDTHRRNKSVSLPRRIESEPRSRSKSLRIQSRSPLPNQHESEDEWVVKEPSAPPVAADEDRSRSATHDADSDTGSELGPQPIYKATTTKKLDERAYGGALLRGEGSAMAAFLQDGTDVRIPRRGEIGLTSGEIAQFENVGYVMSGSRHRRMNAVRMRKENQVISAEEKRGILKLQREERERRESILREEFSELVSDKLKASSTQIPGPSKE